MNCQICCLYLRPSLVCFAARVPSSDVGSLQVDTRSDMVKNGNCNLTEEMAEFRHGQSRENIIQLGEGILEGLTKLGLIKLVTLDNFFPKHGRH